MTSFGRTLVTGWFSFAGMNTTAGDIMAKDVLCGWLKRAGRQFDVALASPFTGGVDWQAVEPDDYAELVFVCGPFRHNEYVDSLFGRFPAARKVGVNLSMLTALDEYQPFDLLVERDSDRTTRVDIAFGAEPTREPVVGLMLVHDQPQYGTRAMHKSVHRMIRRVLGEVPVAVVPIDTRIDGSVDGGFRSAGAVESVIAKTDVVVCTRLHGMVMALKNGVAPVVVDPVLGGAKIKAQAVAIGWPALGADEVTEGSILRSLRWACTDAARSAARSCGERLRRQVERLGDEFVAAMEPLGE